jgi:hypothetical protein
MHQQKTELNKAAQDAQQELLQVIATDNKVTSKFFTMTIDYDNAPYYVSEVTVKTSSPIKQKVYKALIGMVGDKLMDIRAFQNERATRGFPKGWESNEKYQKRWAMAMKAVYEKDSKYGTQYLGDPNNPAVTFCDRQVLNVNSKKYERCLQKVSGWAAIDINWAPIIKVCPEFKEYVTDSKVNAITDEACMVIEHAYQAILVHMNSKNKKLKEVTSKSAKRIKRTQHIVARR